MPKSKGIKYHVVLTGRKEAKIYETWAECRDIVLKTPGTIHKSFKSLEEAERWASAKQKRKSNRRRGSPTKIETEAVEDQAIVVDSDNEDQQPMYSKEPTLNLSPEQATVLERVRAGDNVFFTGPAGTGKSVLLRAIIEYCRGQGDDVAITATTGIAAVNIGGCTLHSWAGIGLGQDTVSKFIGKLCGSDKFCSVRRRWEKTSRLIIDEISMLDGNLFDKLEAIGRRLRNDERPFGGIQLIFCGDFCQLPPVSGKDVDGRETPACFAFDAKSWDKCMGRPMELTQVFRQKDQRFVDMLNEMRYGILSVESIQRFQQLSRDIHYEDGVSPTELYAMRHEVLHANALRLSLLKTEAKTFSAIDCAGYDCDGEPISELRKQQLLEKLVCQEEITLKVGAQVMLIKNLVQDELVNGSVGVVTRFATPTDQANMVQDSETRTDTELRLINTQEASYSPSSDNVYPVVKFICGTERTITPVDFEIINAEGGMEARRTQIPLILAWALSVHKSQGQTLERVKVDLRRTFEKGQAYVAISRATSLEQLQVLNFDPGKYVPLTFLPNARSAD